MTVLCARVQVCVDAHQEEHTLNVLALNGCVQEVTAPVVYLQAKNIEISLNDLLLLWRILNGRGLPYCGTPLSQVLVFQLPVETPIHSPMSCIYLLLGLHLPLLPSHVPSKNNFSNVLCRLMWPKYDNFCFLIRFKSCGAFTSSCSRTLAFVFLSVHEILSIFE